MSSTQIPLAGKRETVGDTLILFALLALVLGFVGSDGLVLVASAPMFIGGLLLRQGRPTAGLLNIPIPVPRLPPVIVAPACALLVIGARFLMVS